MKSECRKYKSWRENHPEKANKVTETATRKEDVYGCYLAKTEICLTTKTDIEKWIIDSGATSHMAQTQTFFEDLDSSTKGYVRLADDEKRVQVEGAGMVAIKCTNASVRKLTKDGYKAIFEGDCCNIVKNNKVLATAKATSELYELQTQKCFKAEAITIKNECDKDCHHVWHRRFGHRYTAAIKELAQKQLATGIKISDCGRNIVCEDCIKGKLARKPFPKESETQTHAALDLVHTDVCGPMQTPTPGNNKYFMTIIDDYSRYTHLYIMSIFFV